DEDVHPLVRHDASDEEHRIALDIFRGWRESFDVDATVDDPRAPLRAVDLATVLANVQPSVVPAVRLHVPRHVPSAASERAGEHSAAGCATEECGHRTCEDVLLVTVHNIGALDLTQDRRRERVAPLTADIPWSACDAHRQAADGLSAFFVAET